MVLVFSQSLLKLRVTVHSPLVISYPASTPTSLSSPLYLSYCNGISSSYGRSPVLSVSRVDVSLAYSPCRLTPKHSDRFTSIHCSNASLSMLECRLFHHSCAYDMKAILFYDWLLCLRQEFECIWMATGGLNAGSLVYALSRFPVMLGLAFTTATIFPLSMLVSNRLSSK